VHRRSRREKEEGRTDLMIDKEKTGGSFEKRTRLGNVAL